MPRKKQRKKLTKQTEVHAHLIPRIHEKKLGREGNWGQQWSGTERIDIDPRQTAYRYLNTLIHEILHVYFVDLNENTVTIIADAIARIIWKKNYRRIQK